MKLEDIKESYEAMYYAHIHLKDALDYLKKVDILIDKKHEVAEVIKACIKLIESLGK